MGKAMRTNRATLMVLTECEPLLFRADARDLNSNDNQHVVMHIARRKKAVNVYTS